MITSATSRDKLRLMAARDATQLAYRKWASLAYGADKVDSDHVREFARNLSEDLTALLQRANNSVGT